MKAMLLANANTQLLVIPVRDRSSCVNVDVAMIIAPSSAAEIASTKFCDKLPVWVAARSGEREGTVADGCTHAT